MSSNGKNSKSPPQSRRETNGASPLAPEFFLPEGCEFRELPFKIGSGRTLASQKRVDESDPGESRIRLRVCYRRADGHLIGKVWFGDGADGPPGHVHGGASAYVLDEAMGSVGWMHYFPVLAANLNFDYHRPTPLYRDLDIEAWVANTEPDANTRRLKIHARLLCEGKICVSGTGEFAVIARSKIALLANPSDPEVQALLADPRLRWADE